MKLLPILLVVLAVLFAGCGDSEEPVLNEETDTIINDADIDVEDTITEEVVVEIVDEGLAPGQLPDSWPQDFILPENMIVVEEIEENGQPVVIVQFIEGVEPMTMSEMYNHFYEGAVGENWTVPVPDQNDCYATSADFYVAVYHTDYRYVTIDGYNDSETIPTIKITWLE